MSNKQKGAIKSIDWYQELLKALFGGAALWIVSELLKRITRRLLVDKRPILTAAGVVYVGWLVFGFLMWAAGTYVTFVNAHPLSTLANYLLTTFGLIFATGISGRGLNRLAYRIDPSHWTARMTKGLETRKKQIKQIKTVPSYIQAVTIDLMPKE